MADLAGLATATEQADATRAAAADRLAQADVPVRVANLSTIWTVLYTEASRYNWMFQFYLRKHGLALSWVGTGRWIFNLSYTEAEFEQVTQAVAARSFADWQGLLADADCCVTPVLHLQEAMQMPHFAERGMWVDVPTAQGQCMTQMALPVQMSDFRFEVRHSAPRKGQHTREVLLEGGLDSDTVADLLARKVVG